MPDPTVSPQARKLGLKPALRVLVVDQPESWHFDGAPALELVSPGETCDLVLLFIREEADLGDRPLGLGQLIRPAGALWIAWPRRAGGHSSDVTDTVLRDAVLPTGLVDVKVAALDDDWSALKFVWRLRRRGD